MFRSSVTDGDPHRKAVLIIRQSLDPDVAYVDAALHGTDSRRCSFETQSEARPTRRLTKRGNDFYMSVAATGEELQISGGSARFSLKEPFYLGLGVCAHNKDRSEKAEFSN